MSEWQPIATAPKKEVILYYPPVYSERRGKTQVAWITIGYAGLTPRKATHWMPLPTPPPTTPTLTPPTPPPPKYANGKPRGLGKCSAQPAAIVARAGDG
jgi:hypothetical protein